MLSNLYMRRFVLGWKVLGHEKRLKAKIVNYADDFVICCRGTAIEASAAMRVIMDQLKLTLNSSVPSPAALSLRRLHRPRCEPRPNWSQCARSQTLVAGQPGTRSTFTTDFVEGRKYFPVAKLTRAA